MGLVLSLSGICKYQYSGLDCWSSRLFGWELKSNYGILGFVWVVGKKKNNSGLMVEHPLYMVY